MGLTEVDLDLVQKVSHAVLLRASLMSSQLPRTIWCCYHCGRPCDRSFFAAGSAVLRMRATYLRRRCKHTQDEQLYSSRVGHFGRF
jgi:hypothetical protein